MYKFLRINNSWSYQGISILLFTQIQHKPATGTDIESY